MPVEIHLVISEMKHADGQTQPPHYTLI